MVIMIAWCAPRAKCEKSEITNCDDGQRTDQEQSFTGEQKANIHISNIKYHQSMMVDE
jgi:hypothetical protein